MPHSASTTYALPSDIRIGNGGALTDDEAKARRVQEQIKLKLAEKSTLPRQNGKASQHPMSDYGGSSTMKYSTYSPGGFTSKSSLMYSGSRTMGPRISQRADFSSRSSGPAIAQFQRMSVGSGVGGGVGGGVAGGGGGYYIEDGRMGFSQGSMRQQNRIEPDTVSVHSMRQMGGNWMYDDDDAGSLISERDSTVQRQFTQSAVNGYSTQMRQGTMNQMAPMPRSLSGTIYSNGGMSGGGTEFIQQQHSFKGPAFRTISRIANRNRMSVGSMSGNQMSSSASSFGRDKMDGGFLVQGSSQGNLNMFRQSTLPRSMSIKSLQSVGRGVDVFDEQMGLSGMDIYTAVDNIRSGDPELQILGAAWIQHQCFNSNEAKVEVRDQGAIGDLVNLFNSDDPVVRRYATGAARNLIYKNMENKTVLVEKSGISELVKALGENDDELRKNITGILWNLSSKDKLKERVAKEAVAELSKTILEPLKVKLKEESGNDSDDPSDKTADGEIFLNTTGCLRNLSSEGEKCRQLMRAQPGIVEGLVLYIKSMVQKKKTNDRGVENSVCILRNLSYQLYQELPSAIRSRLAGPTRDKNTDEETIGCFTPQSKKAKNKKNKACPTINEVTKNPKEMEWLWHPDILGVYHDLLRTPDTTHTSREAAAGALQNLTHGDLRWPSVLSDFAEEKHKMIPTILDRLKTEQDSELRSITGFLRNLSRNTKNKDSMAQQVIRDLLKILPDDTEARTISNPVIVNICGIFNNLVIGSVEAAREITENGGVSKLIQIKDSGDVSAEGCQASRSAGTVLTNMYYYKKLHKLYKTHGHTKDDFVDKFA
ncbi:plakophilin-3a isoform X2 [Oryzias melastigma]|uniref:Plakophilin 3a n=1 Tax=Oryzias melastigma TaxID=30732 RepID=A0A3B3CDQ5_ORYME|nr:plakophilin-3a isoform X2 [Oryzias melastigma]